MVDNKKDSIKDEKLEGADGGYIIPGTWWPVDENCPEYDEYDECRLHPTMRRYDECATCRGNQKGK